MTETTSPTTSTSARRSLDRWLTMWNTDPDIARDICAEDFRIHFAVTEPDGSTPADDIRTADDFVQYLHWWHGQNPGVVFTAIASAVHADDDGEPRGQHGRLLWDVQTPEHHAGGVDVFDFDPHGRVHRVWSVGGQRSMRQA